MIRRSPAEFYIKYLLVHPDGYKDEQVRNLAVLQQLDFIGMPYLERLRKRLAVPIPFYPEDRTHRRSQDFITRERIWYLFHPDEDVLSAQVAVDKPRVKEALEAMLISLSSPEYIAAVIKQRAGFSMTVRAVSMFKHYFFNVDLVDTPELRAIIESRTGAEIDANTTDMDAQRLSISMQSAGKGDPRRMLSKISSPQLTALMNSLRLGYIPSGLDISRLADATRAVATIQAFNSALHGWADSARDFSFVSKAMTEVMQSVGEGATSQTDLVQMLLETEHSDVPHFDSVANVPQLVESHGESVEG